MPEDLSNEELHAAVLILLPVLSVPAFGDARRRVGVSDIPHQRAVGIRVGERGRERKDVGLEDVDVEVEVF